jgi:GWxTD domain-containing protein
MRRQRLVILVCFGLTALLTPIADAQMSGDYAGWADGPEGFLLTKKEKKARGKITTDAEAERFIELFWARRNPEPTSPFNAFRAEFEAKVQFADENLGYTGRRGALSERGWVLMLMGKPHARDLREPIQAQDQSLPILSEEETAAGRIDVWVYETDKLPKKFKTRGPRVVYFFYEDRPDSNSFVLDRSNRESMAAMGALNRAPEVYFLHPDLTQVPKPVSVAGAASASAAHLAWLERVDAPFNDDAIVISELGVADGVERPFWVHLELPPGAPELDLIVGRVKSVEGKVVSDFETTPTPIEGQYGAAYHLSFPLDEGSYTVEIAGAAAGEPQITRSLDAEVTKVPGDGPWMSPIWLGTAAILDREANLGDPFSMAVWHLTPISGPDLTRAAEIAYFGFVVRPAVNEEGAVQLRSRVRLKLDGKSISKPLVTTLDAPEISGDLHVYGNFISMAGLPGPGSYEIEFEITEKNSGTSVERTLLLEITE